MSIATNIKVLFEILLNKIVFENSSGLLDLVIHLIGEGQSFKISHYEFVYSLSARLISKCVIINELAQPLINNHSRLMEGLQIHPVYFMVFTIELISKIKDTESRLFNSHIHIYFEAISKYCIGLLIRIFFNYRE